MKTHLDPAERLAGLHLDEEAVEQCACQLYPAGVIVPEDGCPMHPDARTDFNACSDYGISGKATVPVLCWSC